MPYCPHTSTHHVNTSSFGLSAFFLSPLEMERQYVVTITMEEILNAIEELTLDDLKTLNITDIVSNDLPLVAKLKATAKFKSRRKNLTIQSQFLSTTGRNVLITMCRLGTDFSSRMDFSSLFMDTSRTRILRHILDRLVKYTKGEQTSNRGHRIIPGIRGVGKTTFFLKLLHELQKEKVGENILFCIYISAGILSRNTSTILDIIALGQLHELEILTSVDSLSSKPWHMLIILDEAQDILGVDSDHCRQIKHELASLSNLDNVTLIITGSAYSILDGAFSSRPNTNDISLNNDKIKPMSYTPMCYSEEEYNRCCELLTGRIASIDHTAGIIGNIIESTDVRLFRGPIVPESGTMKSHVYYVIFSVMQRELNIGGWNGDYFTQPSVGEYEISERTGATSLQLARMADEQSLINRGAASDSEPMFSFLWPTQYSMLTQRVDKSGLTFPEECAFFFPEGRTLGEYWEVFRGDFWRETKSIPSFETFDLFSGTINAALSSENGCGKLKPDKFGVDIIMWTTNFSVTGAPQLQVELEQIKVGYAANYVKKEELDIVMDPSKRCQLVSFLTAAFLGSRSSEETSVSYSFKLVKSRKLSKTLRSELEEHKIEVVNASVASYWGSRIVHYCNRSGLKPFTRYNDRKWPDDSPEIDDQC